MKAKDRMNSQERVKAIDNNNPHQRLPESKKKKKIKTITGLLILLISLYICLFLIFSYITFPLLSTLNVPGFHYVFGTFVYLLNWPFECLCEMLVNLSLNLFLMAKFLAQKFSLQDN